MSDTLQKSKQIELNKEDYNLFKHYENYKGKKIDDFDVGLLILINYGTKRLSELKYYSNAQIGGVSIYLRLKKMVDIGWITTSRKNYYRYSEYRLTEFGVWALSEFSPTPESRLQNLLALVYQKEGESILAPAEFA